MYKTLKKHFDYLKGTIRNTFSKVTRLDTCLDFNGKLLHNAAPLKENVLPIRGHFLWQSKVISVISSTLKIITGVT